MLELFWIRTTGPRKSPWPSHSSRIRSIRNLAYSIAERYYGGMHYVWCAPYFDSRDRPSYDPSLPTLEPVRDPPGPCRGGPSGRSPPPEDRAEQARYLPRGRPARAGGDDYLRAKGVIKTVVDPLSFPDFRPLLYVIPYIEPSPGSPSGSRSRSKGPSVSEEYIVGPFPVAGSTSSNFRGSRMMFEFLSNISLDQATTASTSRFGVSPIGCPTCRRVAGRQGWWRLGCCARSTRRGRAAG